VANSVLARCDALDGAADGMVADVQMCKQAFDLATAVPTCGGARDGSCLTAAQKSVLYNVFSGARNSAGTAIYSSFPYDAGINRADWRQWEFSYSQSLDTAVGFVFSTPPLGPSRPSGHRFRARIQHGHRCAEHLREHCALHRVIDVLHDAAEPEQPFRASRPRQQAHRLSRHQRCGVLVGRHDKLVRAIARGERRRCIRLCSLLSGARHESLRARPSHRPVRHADAARRGWNRARRLRRSLPRLAGRAPMWSTPNCLPTGRPIARRRCARIQKRRPT